MENRQHALLSPSAAHRWLHCTAAPLLEAKEEDGGSVYAAEGTLAHAMCAKELNEWLGRGTVDQLAEIVDLHDLYHTGEMDEYVSAYVEFVKERLREHRARLSHSTLLVEVRLDFSDYVPDSFGTSDAVIVGDGIIEIIDFKYGKGVPVSAERNPQMMIYALGALDRFEFDYDVEFVRMTIFQPRLGSISTWEMSTEDLRWWAEHELKPKAQEALSGGEQHAGDWCQFCKVKGRCRALFDDVTSADLAAPALMSAEEVAAALGRIPLIKQWITAVEDHALTSALGGTHYPGYKLVRGRSNRVVTDPQAAADALVAEGYDRSAIVKPMQLCGLTDLEKLVGKKRLAEVIGKYITKPEGKPTLVEDSDKREAIDPAKEMFNDINI